VKLLQNHSLEPSHLLFLMTCRNTSDSIDHPLSKHFVSAQGASHHAWAPGSHHLNPALCTCFSKDAESLTTYGWVLWCSHIVYIRPYSLSTTPAFYFVTGCPDIAVFVR